MADRRRQRLSNRASEETLSASHPANQGTTLKSPSNCKILDTPGHDITLVDHPMSGLKLRAR